MCVSFFLHHPLIDHESYGAATSNLDTYEYKTKKTVEKYLVLLRFEPGTPNPKSALLAP